MITFIDKAEYINILNKMPIPCVDIVVVKEKKVLLLLRKEYISFGGKWWLPGGRINKNETLEKAAKRKVLEETGINVKIKKQLRSYEVFDKKSSFKEVKTGTHTISSVFLAEPKEDKSLIKLDSSHDKYKWADKIETSFHPYIRNILKDSEVFR